MGYLEAVVSVEECASSICGTDWCGSGVADEESVGDGREEEGKERGEWMPGVVEETDGVEVAELVEDMREYLHNATCIVV